ncbi:MAG: TetR/AcrR family transcriptional regulator [Phycisphaerales bacterium]|nr:TetR/AcrR family transcriptional regulator [Phycisphaerales bacterium]
MLDVQNPPSTPVETPPAARKGDRTERRAEILRLALDLFSKKGYTGTTMAEIATAAGLAVGTLYKFFKDKNDLYQALLSETVHDFESRLLAVLKAEGPPIDRLNRFIDVGSQLFVEHLPMTRVYFSQTAAAFLFASAGLEDESYLSYRRIVDAVAEVCAEAVRRGEMVDLPPAVLALGLEGVHNGFLAALVRDPGCYTPTQIATYTKQMFFAAVRK